MAKVGRDTSAYFVEKFDETGSSAFSPILGEDVKNMLRGFDYHENEDEYVSPDGKTRYKLRFIG